MKHYKLREFAKFAAGLVAGDFIALWWIDAYHLFPVSFLGTTMTQQMAVPGLIFDAALFLMLVHYGWNVGKIPAVRERTYLAIVGIVFGIVGILHLLRLFFGTNVAIAGWTLPLWLSWIGVIITLYLAYMSFRLATTHHMK